MTLASWTHGQNGHKTDDLQHHKDPVLVISEIRAIQTICDLFATSLVSRDFFMTLVFICQIFKATAVDTDEYKDKSNDITYIIFIFQNLL